MPLYRFRSKWQAILDRTAGLLAISVVFLHHKVVLYRFWPEWQALILYLTGMLWQAVCCFSATRMASCRCHVHPLAVRMVPLYTNRPKRQAPSPIPSTPVKNGCLFPWLWYNTLMQNEKTILITASGKVMVFSVRSCAVLYQQAFGGILTDLVKYPENACQNQSVLV
jgi:hypothetical protein